MEPNEDQPVQVMPQQAVVSHIKPKGSGKRVVVTLVLALLLAASGALGYMFYKTQNENTQLNAELTSTKGELKLREGELAGLKGELSNAVTDKEVSYFSPQCEGKNEDNLLISKLNKTPVQEHNAYLVTCKQEMQKSNPLVKVTVLKVNDDGTKSFKYGAGSGEPRCISSKILGAVATELQQVTGLPNCKTF